MKAPFSWSIRTQLLILVLLASLPSLAIILYSGFENKARSRHDAEQRIMQQVDTLAENHVRTMTATRQLLMTLAQLPVITDGAPPERNHLLHNLLKQNPLFLNILIADTSGNIIASAIPHRAVSISDRDYFHQVLATRSGALGGYSISRTTLKPAIHYAYPILAANGAIRAVAIIALDIEHYSKTFATAGMPAGSALALTSSQGTRIYRYPHSQQYYGVADLPTMLQRMGGHAERGSFVAEGIDGVTRLYGFRRINLVHSSTPLYIRVGIPNDLVTAEARSSLVRNLLFIIGATVLALLFTWFLGDMLFVRRLSQLAAAARKIAGGDLETRTGIAAGEGEIGRVASALDDMASELHSRNSERTAAEAALKESETRLNLVLQGSSDGFWDWDMATREVQHSDRWAEMLGYLPEEISTHVTSWKALVHPDDMPEVIQVFKDHLAGRKSQYRIEYRMRCKNGSWKWILDRGRVVAWDAQGSPSRMAGTATDITERKHAEAEKKLLTSQLLQAQKMEAVGQLAGGIAHDFNNILTAIVGYGNLILMKTAKDDAIHSYTEHVLAAADRGATLTRSMLAFGRRQLMHPEPVKLHEILVRVEKLLQRLIGEDIELHMELSPHELVIMADSGQIEQVLMNLATNARDAMSHGGTITIRTNLIPVSKNSLTRTGVSEPGLYACLICSDTGTGMDPEVMQKIFEPFFTTKEVGKGSGLGLAMVYGIIQQHNGHITVASTPGGGTTFSIFLPIHDGSSEACPDVEPLGPCSGSETILVAEDDAVIRALSQNLLEANGYQVILAHDGMHALEQYQQHREQIKLLILDLILPKRNGRDVYLCIREMDPAIRVLFISGYTADVLEQKGLREGGLDFLAKPVRPTVLLHRVRELLDGGTADTAYDLLDSRL